ncbi:MAG: glycosyltransferase [Armatimonadota bacterium]
MLSCVIGIMAYNEEANVGELLERLLAQKSRNVKIREIYVIASGCTDRTVEITAEYMKKSPLVNVVVQEKREGKASAINFFLHEIKANFDDIIVLISADTLPDMDLIDNLITPFRDGNIGMTSGHPVPINDLNTFIGYTVQLVWKLHHQIALVKPKMGEVIAFRNVFYRIPFDSAVDEANIEPLILGQGYILKYIPEAVLKNKGPTTVKDYIKQRRRIYSGHVQVRKYQGYSTSTMNPFFVLGKLAKIMDRRPKYVFWTIGAVLLEGYCRILGKLDSFSKKKDHAVWDISESTKDLKKC